MSSQRLAQVVGDEWRRGMFREAVKLGTEAEMKIWRLFLFP